MAKVTYRGVEYDTDEYNRKVLNEASQQRNRDLMYRGLKVNRPVAAWFKEGSSDPSFFINTL